MNCVNNNEINMEYSFPKPIVDNNLFAQKGTKEWKIFSREVIKSDFIELVWISIHMQKESIFARSDGRTLHFTIKNNQLTLWKSIDN